MIESWPKAVKLTLGLEGLARYTNDPRDPGGPTKYGIAGKYHPGVDIEHLTQEQAEDIYYREYWVPAGCDDAPFPFDICLFDSQVNPQNDPRLPGGGNQELMLQNPKDWIEYNMLRMIRYMHNSKPVYVSGHIQRVLRLSESIRALL